MTTRRTFIKRSAAGIAATAIQSVLNTDETFAASTSGELKDGGRIRSMSRREDTIIRRGGYLSVGQFAWLADDQQLFVVGDGCGWPKVRDKYWSTRFYKIDGSAKTARFHELSNQPDMLIWDWMDTSGDKSAWYPGGVISVDGCIYAYLSTFDRPLNIHTPGSWTNYPSNWKGVTFNTTKVIYSPDNGRTWHNQDGSTPVVLERQPEKSAKNMLFFRHRNGVFTGPIFLQMGKDYQDNRDGYVYAYSANGTVDSGGWTTPVVELGALNELVMFRVPKTKILDASAYEYLAGLQPDGSAIWVKDIEARAVVHTFPKSWGASSFAYNKPLGLYMMAGGGGGSGPMGKGSYIAFWVAPNPWGPWKQIPWTPHGDEVWKNPAMPTSRPGGAAIIPKWIAEDGKTFWIAWSEATPYDINEPLMMSKTEAEFNKASVEWGEASPYYSFNAQRVDVIFN